MFRKIKASEAPKRRRKVASLFEATTEWRLMKEALDAGLKPQEALEVVLTPADKKKYGLEHRRTVTRFIQKYVRSLGQSYTVKSFEREMGSFFLVIHEGRPVQAATRKTG